VPRRAHQAPNYQLKAVVKGGGEGIGDVDRPVSGYVYRIFSDEFQYFGIQIRWKLIRRRCGDGEREERKTQREDKDVHGVRASHLAGTGGLK
jgi:hypothetical protein